MPVQIGTYELLLKSNPQAFDFSKANIKYFPFIQFQDSIFDFFPILEFQFKDDMNAILDQVGFVENLQVSAGLGNQDDGYLGHDYIWLDDQLQQTAVADNMSGTNLITLVSYYARFNHPKSRAWNDTIENVLKDILLKDYNIKDSSKIYISPTLGTDYWYQANTKNSDFIKGLSRVALSKNYPTSPFYTFFNTNGDFYFMTIDDLMAQPYENDEPYILLFDPETSKRFDCIQDYNVTYGGYNTNFDNYQVKTYQLEETGSFTNKTQKIGDQIYKEDEVKDKVQIRNAYMETSNVMNLGIYESATDKYNFQGKINAIWQNSNLSNRMQITVLFNPALVTGKVINLEIGSYDDSKANKLKSFSGTWLIIQSQQLISDQNAMTPPYVSLMLARGSNYIDPKQAFYGEYQ
jgi:hypothetical protein